MTTEGLTPVAPAERVQSIDILRGLALFGILAANMRGFAGPAIAYFRPMIFWPALHDRVAQAFIDTFVQGKFLAIFAFLFGVGFAVQLERARDRNFARIYARRMIVLILFGLAHGLLIWWGDILLIYGVIGLVLLAFRNRSDKTVVMWAVIGYAIPLFILTTNFLVSGDAPRPSFPREGVLEQLRVTFASGSWLDIQRQRMRDASGSNWDFLPIMFWRIGALFLLGMLAWRRRWLQPAPEMLPRYRRVMIAAIAIALPLNLAVTVMRRFFDVSPRPEDLLSWLANVALYVATPLLSLGYVCLVLIVCSDDKWRARLRSFAAVGRMALTNYLLQSVIGTLIFYSYGLGLFGRLGPAWLLPLTVVIYAVQVVFSRWWMSRFRFGPVEWLWRTLTYGRHFALVDASTASLPSGPTDRPAL